MQAKPMTMFSIVDILTNLTTSIAHYESIDMQNKLQKC